MARPAPTLGLWAWSVHGPSASGVLKLRTGSDLKLRVDLSVMVDAQGARQLELDLRQAIDDVGLTESVKVEEGEAD